MPAELADGAWMSPYLDRAAGNFRRWIQRKRSSAVLATCVRSMPRTRRFGWHDTPYGSPRRLDTRPRTGTSRFGRMEVGLGLGSTRGSCATCAPHLVAQGVRNWTRGGCIRSEFYTEQRNICIKL